MITIHKFTLNAVPGKQTLEVRKHAKLLKCAVWCDKLTLWFEVDTNKPFKELQFILYFTGEEIDASVTNFQKYIDTFSVGGLVFHLYKFKP